MQLKASVDRTLGELRRIQDHFAKFVPEAVKRLVTANPDTTELAKRAGDVSVLFLDISGYTHLSEPLAPEQLNTLVARYFSTFLDRIHDAGGDINETAGDGFMAIFQDPAYAVTAVDTALALLVATTAIHAEKTGQPLTVHMGINSGTALVGSTRFGAGVGRAGPSRPADLSPTSPLVWQVLPHPAPSSATQRRRAGWAIATLCNAWPQSR